MTTEERLEIEVKIPLSDPAGVRRRIGEQGFRLRAQRAFERNLVFDFPDGGLQRRGILLRLRQQGESVWLTLKQPAEADERYKVRRELEVRLDSFGAARQILEGLGLHVSFIYEKYREIFSAGRVSLLLDETPIGTFLEIEGSRPEIDRAAAALGFAPQHYVCDTYFQLFQKSGRPGFMTFAP